MSEPPLLQLERVTVLRDGRAVLRDFSLVVRHPEHVAIVGPNGAGKSTLLKVLSRECYPVPSPDTVCRILGRDRWNVFALRGGLGIVSNDLAASLDPTATVRDVVLSGFFGAPSLGARGDITQAQRDAAEDAMERLGIAALAGRRLETLSSGEARRAAIARALAHGPRALVFDEPSTALDLAARHDVREAMRTLARDGVSIVLVTHHIEDVIPEIERVVFLEDGRIGADGPKAELFAADRLSALFGVPVRVDESDGYYYAR